MEWARFASPGFHRPASCFQPGGARHPLSPRPSGWKQKEPGDLEPQSASKDPRRHPACQDKLVEASMAGCAAAGAPPFLPLAGTLRPPHSRHYLSSSPLLDSETICSQVPLSEPWAQGWFRVGREAQGQNEVSNLSRPQVGSAAASQCQWHEESGFCVSGLEAAISLSRQLGGKRAGVAAPRRVCSVPAEAAAVAAASAAPLRSPSRRGFSSWFALPRVAGLREGTAAARPQPTCPLASRAGVKPPTRRAAWRK